MTRDILLITKTFRNLLPESSLSRRSDCGSAITLHVATDDRPPDLLQEFEHNVLQDRHRTDHVIRKLPASDDCNCHGWVFAGGHYWLEADDVECILSENGYQPVSIRRLATL